MHDKERKNEEYFHFWFFVGSFFFVGSRSNWNAVLCQKSNDNFMFWNFHLIQPLTTTTTMNMSWNEESITSPIDNMYWRSPNIYLKLNWTQFDNAVRLSFVLFVHFNIRIHVFFLNPNYALIKYRLTAFVVAVATHKDDVELTI